MPTKRKRPPAAKVVLPKEALDGEQKFLADLAQQQRERSLAHYNGHRTTYDEALHASIVATYFRAKGNLAKTSRLTQVPYGTLLRWRQDYPDLDRDLSEVWQILVEEASGLYTERALNPDTHMPAWLIFFLKTHDERYREKPKQKRIDITITDRTLRSPKAIAAAQVTKEEVLDA